MTAKPQGKASESSDTIIVAPDALKTPMRASAIDLLSSVFSLICHSVDLLVFMPRAIYESGIILSLVQIVLFAIAGYHTNTVLTRCAKIHKVESMVDLIDKIFTRTKIIFLVIFMVYVIGNIILDQIFLIRNLVDLYAYLANKSYYVTMDVKFMGLYITILINILLLPSFFFKTLERIKLFSVFAVMTTFCVVSLIVISFVFPEIVEIPSAGINWEEVQLFNIYKLPNAFAFYMISFVTHDISIDMCSELKPNTAFNRKRLFKYTFTILAVVFSLVSICGYLTLYDKEGFDDMENYFLFILVGLDKKLPLVLISNCMLTSAFLFNCMLNLIPLTKFIDEYMARKLILHYDENEVRHKTLLLKLCIMLSSFILIVLVVWFRLDVETILNEISNVTLPWIFFMIPLASYFITFQKQEKLNKNLFNLLGAFIGLIAFLCVFDTM